MAVNQVIYGGRTLIDLSSDTVTPATLAKGATAHDASGNPITGTLSRETETWVLTLEDDSEVTKVVVVE